MIISLLNQKGGVGKTTLSIHIASTLALAGEKVLLVDADVQRSALDWAASRDGEILFPVVGISKNSIHKEIPLLTADYDHIIIDGPPRVYDVARSAIAASDLVLIPINPSPYDVWAAKEVVDLVNEVKEPLQAYRKITSAFVINRKVNNTVISRDVVEALEQYKSIPVLESQISQRISYAETAARGSTVIEEDPDSVAGKEIKKLVQEIINFHKARMAA
ncbi:MAG: AAA family ATPase [Candidatus Levybacteria bacterium]|jgi:chromosome partitioning protein|nr:AAA family ATPase [Candidatus Levybacteria bacterium]